MDTLLKNACIVTMDEQNPVIKKGYIAIKDGKIAEMGEDPKGLTASSVIDMADKLLMPGLINTHVHLPMVLLRGYADDYSLHEWLFEHVMPVERRFDDTCFYTGAMLALAECLRFGVTSVTDMYMGTSNIAKAVLESGMKANLSNGGAAGESADFSFLESKDGRELNELVQQWHQSDQGRIKIDGSIHAEYTSFSGFWEQAAAFAQERGLNMHLHLSETKGEHERCLEKYKKTPAQLFMEAGVFENRTTAAHCVYVSPEDMDIMKRYHVTCAHNPTSNLKLASGIAPVSAMRELKINVSLGTDGASSNNSLDLFSELKLASILQKGSCLSPTVLPAEEALYMATRAGAYAQGRELECGMLKVGYDADLIALDLSQPGLMPVHNPVSTLCYSAKGSDVCLTMVRGKILFRDGEYYTIDREKVNHALNGHVMTHLFNA